MIDEQKLLAIGFGAPSARDQDRKASRPTMSHADAPPVWHRESDYALSHRPTPKVPSSGLSQALAERGRFSPLTRQGPVWPVGMPGFSQTNTEMPSIHPLMSRSFMRLLGLGMDYTPNPTPGDYHIVGSGVILRSRPDYTSPPIATLQNGEGVYVFGNVETDPAYKIDANDNVVPNPGDWAGIDYVQVGTQSHGAGWVAMPYIQPGAGQSVQPKPTPSPSPSSKPAASSEMGLTTKVLLGTAIAVTIGGGSLLLWKAVKEAKPRRLAHA